MIEDALPLPLPAAIPADVARDILDVRQVAKELDGARAKSARWREATADKERNPLVDEDWAEEARAILQAHSDDKPAEDVTWGDIEALEESDPSRGEALWQRVRQEGREDLASGWRAARVVSCRGRSDSPHDRARFLAVRDCLREEWNPRPGVESLLVDQLAQLQTVYEEWLGRHIDRMTFSPSYMTEAERRQREYEGLYTPLRVSESEEMDQTAAMADRWQKAILRTVRSLRDLRRHAPVIIQNAGQVNVGQQQVNVAGTEEQRTVAG